MSPITNQNGNPRNGTENPLNGTNSSTIKTNSRKVYRRPILNLEQREPINKILEDQYNYLVGLGLSKNNRGENEAMDQTLQVWEFINGEDSMPKTHGSTTAPILETVPTTGGRRRKSRKSRKSKKSTR